MDDQRKALRSLTREELILEVERLRTRLAESADAGAPGRGLDDVMRYGEIYLSRYRELFDQAPVSIWEEDWSGVKRVIDRMRQDGVRDFREYLGAHGEFVYDLAREIDVLDFNAATVEIYRAPSKQAFWSIAVDDFLSIGEFDIFFATLVALAEGEVKVSAEGWEKTYDGGKICVRDTVFVPSPYRDDWGRVIHVVEDISDQRNAQDALRRAEKLEALGQLTGGLAHDLNNLLGLVATNIELLREKLDAESEAMALATEAMEVARSGTAFVRQLLAFGRRRPPEARAVDIDALIDRLGPLLERTLGESVVLEREGPARIVAWIDPLLLENAVVNLAINARDAMPGGGRLTLGTARIGADAATSAPGFARLSITDTGTGMEPQVLERSLEPFFTTKAKEAGSGLGLSMVDSFIKQSGGRLEIDSVPGRGTTVALYLPLAAGEAGAGPEAAETEALAAEPTGSETILLVEDDPWLRRVVARNLGGLGYQVIETDSGVAALAVLDDGAAVDLLLTDIVMPGEIGGRELVRRARERYPGLKVLYLSSYPEAVAEHVREFDHDVPLLHKPVAREELAARIRAHLDRG